MNKPKLVDVKPGMQSAVKSLRAVAKDHGRDSPEYRAALDEQGKLVLSAMKSALNKAPKS
jgi:hypothetical protein